MSGSEEESGSQKFASCSLSGNKERFQEWKTKTLSLARVMEVHKYLVSDMKVPSETEAEALDENNAE